MKKTFFIASLSTILFSCASLTDKAIIKTDHPIAKLDMKVDNNYPLTENDLYTLSRDYTDNWLQMDTIITEDKIHKPYTYVRCSAKVFIPRVNKSIDIRAWAMDNDKYFKLNGFWPKTTIDPNSQVVRPFITDVSQNKVREVCQNTLTSQAAAQTQEEFTLENVIYSAANNALSFDHNIWFNQIKKDDKINTLVSFGDSISDTGNTSNLLLWNSPARDNWYFGRFTNGLTFMEYAAEFTYLKYYNQAWAAAGIDKQQLSKVFSYVANKKLYIPSLAQQIDYFNSNIVKKKVYKPEQTIFTIFIGSNDFITYKKDVSIVKANIAIAIEKLIKDSHAKNIVLVNIPNITSSPVFQYLGKDAAQYIYSQVKKLNNELGKIAQLLNNQDIHITVFDTYSAFNNIMNNYQEYGFINKTDACIINSSLNYDQSSHKRADCNGYNYVFFDNLHPSSTTTRILGKNLSSFIQKNYASNL